MMRTTQMSLVSRVAVSGLAALALVACNGGHGDHGPDTTNFTGFVSNLAANPSETGEPIPIDDANFTFSEDPHAFDGLFQ